MLLLLLLLLLLLVLLLLLLPIAILAQVSTSPLTPPGVRARGGGPGAHVLLICLLNVLAGWGLPRLSRGFRGGFAGNPPPGRWTCKQ